MNIKYEITEAKLNIFAVVISNSFDRAMTFCRVQEFYESPNPAFRNKNFNMWDYIKWYSEEYGKGFTYTHDWAGFNIPFNVLHECFKDLKKFDTPYDEIMCDIYHKILHAKKDGNAYVIGVDNSKSETFLHEVCHGLYYVDPSYKSEVDGITESIPKKYKKQFSNNLIKAGYAEHVVDDEIQAYLTFGYESQQFSNKVPIELCENWNKEYKKIFQNF